MDYDPVVVSHAQALLVRNPATAAINGDLREPEQILSHPAVQALIDFTEPVAMLLVAVLHFLRDYDKPHAIVDTLTAAMPAWQRPDGRSLGPIPMTDVKTRTRASRTPTPGTIARAAVAALLALAAPAVSFPPAMTTDIHGSGATVAFPHGYAVTLVVTVVVTAVACALGALIAARAGLAAIPIGLAVWAVIGFALIIAGTSLGHHAHLTDRGIALRAAALAWAAIGLPLAARR